MIAAAKQLALNPDNKIIHSKWQQTNNEVKLLLLLKSHYIFSFKLIDAIGNVREILQPTTSNLTNGLAKISFNHNSRSCMFII